MNFFIYNYIFYSMSKNTLIILTYLFICFEKRYSTMTSRIESLILYLLVYMIFYLFN